MAKKKGQKLDPRVISDRWFQQLRDALNHPDAPSINALSRAADMSRSNAWLTLSKTQPTVTAAVRLARALNELMPEADLPPPIWGVEDAEHYRWILTGARLLSLDPMFFGQMLELAEARAANREQARRADQEAMEMLRQLELADRLKADSE